MFFKAQSMCSEWMKTIELWQSLGWAIFEQMYSLLVWIHALVSAVYQRNPCCVSK
jgi:hypothetical protein